MTKLNTLSADLIRFAMNAPITETHPFALHTVAPMVQGCLMSDLNGSVRFQYFAWPGGYDNVYVVGPNDLLCSDCATKVLQNNIAALKNETERALLSAEASNSEPEFFFGSFFIPQDFITSAFSTGDSDEATYCDDCGKRIGEVK